jgi:predicted GNAT family N-acyltransferase
MQVAISQCDDELDGIAKLRYAIYVAEQGKALRYADHVKQTLLEPSDRTGTNIFIKNDDHEIVGAGRLHFVSYSDDIDRALHRASVESASAGASAFVSRVVVKPGYRKGPLTGLLLQALYKQGIDFGCHTALALVREPNRKIFGKAGFLQYAAETHIPEFGLVAPMILPASDREYIARHAPLFEEFAHTLPQNATWTANFWAWLNLSTESREIA